MADTLRKTQKRRPLSPCINICNLDEKAGMCVGCGRTVHEISNWLRFSDEEREAAWKQLPARLEKLRKS